MGYFSPLISGMSVISSTQIKAARSLLGINSKELSELTEVSWTTIRRFEEAPGIPPSRSGNLEKVKTALEARAVVFLGDPIESPGVQLVKIK
jgi:hypothetical protein